MRALKVGSFIYLATDECFLRWEKCILCSSVGHNHKFLNIWSHDEIANMTETVQEACFFQIPLTPLPTNQSNTNIIFIIIYLIWQPTHSFSIEKSGGFSENMINGYICVYWYLVRYYVERII